MIFKEAYVMKKTLFVWAAVLALAACSKEPVEPLQQECAHLELDFNMGNGMDPDTRGIQKSWSHGDEIYIFFDREILATPQYLVAKYDKSGSVTGKANSWYASFWSDGLEAKISRRSGGVLSALYTHTSSVHGATRVLYWNASKYSITTGTLKNGNFYSYWLEATNVSYTVSNGKLSASLTLGRPDGRYFIQFSMPNKDRDGKAISNADAQSSTVYMYMLTCKEAEASTWPMGVSQCHPNSYNSDGTFGYYDSGYGNPGALSAYIYGGLCFSGLQMTSTSLCRYKFFLYEYGPQSTKGFVYEPDYKITLTAGAYKLPALNAKDSSGNYYWRAL